MIRFKGPDGSYEPNFIDCWFTKFFQYDLYGKIIQGPIQEFTILPQ